MLMQVGRNRERCIRPKIYRSESVDEYPQLQFGGEKADIKTHTNVGVSCSGDDGEDNGRRDEIFFSTSLS